MTRSIFPWSVEAVWEPLSSCWALSPGRAGWFVALVIESLESETSHVEQVLVRERPLLHGLAAVGTGIVIAFNRGSEASSGTTYWQPTEAPFLVVSAESRIAVVTSGAIGRVCALFKTEVDPGPNEASA